MRSSRCDGAGNLHTLKNVGEGVGRRLVSQAPGGLYEQFFEKIGMKVVDGEVGLPVCKDQPDVWRIMKVAAEHGIEIPVPIA